MRSFAAAAGSATVTEWTSSGPFRIAQRSQSHKYGAGFIPRAIQGKLPGAVGKQSGIIPPSRFEDVDDDGHFDPGLGGH